MTRHTSYRFRLYPTAAQSARLLAWQDALRFLWNLAIEQRRLALARPRCERRYYSALGSSAEVTELRQAVPWLAEVPRNLCESVLADLDGAWRNCFEGRSREPGWKRKGRDVPSLRETKAAMWSIDQRSVSFPKLGPVCAVIHRQPEGRPRSCSITRDGDQWFASLLYEQDVADPAPRTSPAVAIDRGVTNVVADSDGNVIPSPRFYQHSLRRLAHAQRTVARRQKGSANREKAKLRVARLHRKVRRQREHFIHNLSATYAKSHGTVVVEKLNTAGMVRTGKRGLSRGILDAGWYRLVETLRYKLAWSGGQLVEVPAAYSSQTCSACGTVDAASRKGERFACTGCGHVDHADTNAAKVLLLRASRPLMPVEGPALEAARRSRKPNPADYSDLAVAATRTPVERKGDES